MDNYGQTLKQFLPFDSDYSRHDARLYEAYRTRAIECLQRHHRLSMMRAYLVVDDAIAAHERLVPSLMIARKDAE